MRFNYKNTSNTSEKDIAKAAKQISGYFNDLQKGGQDFVYETDEASLYLPNDAGLRKQVKNLVKEKSSPKLREVIVVGIGGSNLGTWAVYDAVMPDKVKLSFYDTVHSRNLAAGVGRIKQIYKDGGAVILNLISKSGGTTETIANARVLIQALRSAQADWQNQVVATTQPGSKFEDWALGQKIATLPNPAHVGGRYSVLSAVGLFPLAMAGIDIDKLRKGAARMLGACVTFDVGNPALQSAAAIYKAMQNGKSIHDLFLFNPDLERLGKWYRQLAGESLGKEKNLAGKIVHAGITPTVSIGSTDLHSVGQLYLAGPKDKFTTFIQLKSSARVKVPSIDEELDNIAADITGKSLDRIMSAIYQGTREAYKKRRLPFVEVELENQSEEEIGAFMQFKMCETMILGRLMGVNAFDQPNVEEYKVITKRLLGG